ncbi:MAG: hypothetical protein HKN99_01045 [Winogradskyella sp.]|nr:hypothetical protein [Winogradskyella sp.]MBT8375692.1 hypothetical protein [Bacteroidia bacterium]NNC44452.1 hypothetical protein [Winogradskyella sp.]NNF86014.1 hypothetical protein [Winogradskyella sp.]
MIKFIRQIRYNLISENKTGKYFKYAIGEIILVVIGILIALQINNWNIENSNSAQEQAYLKRLIQELDDEMTNYTRIKENFTNQQEAINALLAIWNEPNTVIRDTTSFWRNFSRATGAGPWYQEPVTWTQLIQSGELKLIKDQKTIETLFKHYGFLKRVAANFSEYPTQTTSDIRKLTAVTYSEINFSISIDDNRPMRSNPELLDKILSKKKEFKALFVRVGIVATFHKGQMESLLESAENAKMILKTNLL